MSTQITSESIAGANVAIGPDGTVNAFFNSATFDAVLGPTPGAIAVRGAVAWSMLAPGAAGSVLQTNGANNPPSWVANNSTLNSGAVDAAFGAGVGSVLYRSAGGWTTLPVGASLNSVVTNSGGVPTWQTVSATMDSAFSSAQGAVLYRDAGIWKALAPGSAGQLLSSGGAGANPSWVAPAGTGTVTSVGLTLPAIFSVTGSPVTVSGTIAATLANQNANLVFAGPASGGAAAPTFRALTTADFGVLQTSKNYFLNGAMMVNQRYPSGTSYVGVAGTTSGYQAVDQTSMSFTNAGAFSFAQVASATPGGSPARLRLTVTAADASVGASDILIIQQRIEGSRVADLGFGGSSAKTITVPFGVRAPAGTYGVAVNNGAFTRSYVSEFTVAVGEANTDVVKYVTVPGDTAGTWLKDSGVGLVVSWCLMAGSTYQQAAGSWAATNTYGTSNQFNFAGTNGNVFELFDVGLYAGSLPPATFQVPDFAAELAECMRYYEKSYDYGTAIATATQTGAALFYSNAASGVVSMPMNFKVEKRASPTVSVYSPLNGAAGAWLDDQTTPINYAVTLKTTGTKSAAGYTFPGSANPRLVGHWTADASM